MSNNTKNGYATIFKDRFMHIKNFSDKRIRILNDFVSLISQRIECEEIYSKTMKKISTFHLGLHDEYCFLLRLVQLVMELNHSKLIV